MTELKKFWPKEGPARVPYWVYSDPEVYQRELERIFAGPTWNYVGLEVEVPRPGDFKRTHIGEESVVLVRGKKGDLYVHLNRCTHRGLEVCRESFGNKATIQCPYHQWTYDLCGNLVGVPFRKGVLGQGGMPADFDTKNHGLTSLKVHARGGVIFASFDKNAVPFANYLGETMLKLFDRVFDGRKLTVLGYSRQLIPSNWKLMFENIKDPYHASLLHVFLVTFGLFRADQKSEIRMDSMGRHGALISRKGEQKAGEGTADMASFKADFKLKDPRLLDPVKEFPDANTVVMQTIFPNLIVQQQSNTLATRQIVPRGPNHFELVWTFFGYENDSPEMTQRRLRQANLMGPAGLVSVDDGEALCMTQDGVRAARSGAAVLELGGRDCDGADHMVTESCIRGFYKYYAEIMGFGEEA
ncbi:MAG: aromatic ring-hydroxylating dioxygenase subunit alpha [Bdellovibrionota bacterium]